jgi:hypothetical protein
MPVSYGFRASSNPGSGLNDKHARNHAKGGALFAGHRVVVRLPGPSRAACDAGLIYTRCVCTGAGLRCGGRRSRPRRSPRARLRCRGRRCAGPGCLSASRSRSRRRSRRLRCVGRRGATLQTEAEHQRAPAPRGPGLVVRRATTAAWERHRRLPRRRRQRPEGGGLVDRSQSPTAVHRDRVKQIMRRQPGAVLVVAHCDTDPEGRRDSSSSSETLLLRFRQPGGFAGFGRVAVFADAVEPAAP